jgi:hypothetical protein
LSITRIRLVLAAALAAALTACGGGGSSRALPPGLAPQSAPARGTMTVQVVQKNLPMTNHGGPVQTEPQVYFVFWGSAWTSGSPTSPAAGPGDPNGVRPLAKAFARTLGGSAYLKDVQQFGAGNTGNIYAGTALDATDPPAAPTENDMAAEALKAARTFNAGAGVNRTFVIFTPHGVTPPGFPATCAYHTATMKSNGMPLVYAVMPYVVDGGAGCGAGAVNNPGTTDGVTMQLGRIIAETETDPLPNDGRGASAGFGPLTPNPAWADANGNEIGYSCTGHSEWNIVNPSAGNYPTQPLWNNSSHACRQGPNTIPVSVVFAIGDEPVSSVPVIATQDRYDACVALYGSPSGDGTHQCVPYNATPLIASQSNGFVGPFTITSSDASVVTGAAPNASGPLLGIDVVAHKAGTATLTVIGYAANSVTFPVTVTTLSKITFHLNPVAGASTWSATSTGDGGSGNLTGPNTYPATAGTFEIWNYSAGPMTLRTTVSNGTINVVDQNDPVSVTSGTDTTVSITVPHP